MTYYERRLPHWHSEGRAIFVTWRLHGSLPAVRAREIARAAGRLPGKRFVAIDRQLDCARSGPLWLQDSKIADYVVDTILRAERELGAYSLHAFVVMANHVHLLLTPSFPLPRIMKGLKGTTAYFANRRLTRIGKLFWQDECFDHWVRTPAEFHRIVNYIENNPVSAGFVNSSEQWQWSSAACEQTQARKA